MNIKELTSAQLCQRLTEGWTSDRCEAPKELLARLRSRWLAHVGQESAGNSAYRAVLEVNEIRFAGASELGCLLLLGAGASIEREVKDFWRQFGGDGRLVLVLAATQTVMQAVRQFAPWESCVVLGSADIQSLLGHGNPLELLKQHVRSVVPTRRLLPYNIIHPVGPNMFFGRRELLDKLLTQDMCSFAIAGPGRIGKSSLLKQYRYELKTSLEIERRHRSYFIDCYPYAHLDSDAFARRLALDISADSEANRVKEGTLLRFLRRHSHDGRCPIELVLDEVDRICMNDSFQELGEAVRSNYCRVILCGRGALHRMMRRKETQFAQRIELIQPEPLDDRSARRLLLEPLTDLGFRFESTSDLCSGILDLTDRLPHLIQMCAKRLAELTLAGGGNTITLTHLQRVCEEMAMSASSLPLEDMEDDATRLTALLWLQAGGGSMTVGSLQRLLAKYEIALTASKCLDICYDLWICNILSQRDGKFLLTNSRLIDFVRRMDFGPEIKRLLRSLA